MVKSLGASEVRGGEGEAKLQPRELKKKTQWEGLLSGKKIGYNVNAVKAENERVLMEIRG